MNYKSIMASQSQVHFIDIKEAIGQMVKLGKSFNALSCSLSWILYRHYIAVTREREIIAESLEFIE